MEYKFDKKEILRRLREAIKSDNTINIENYYIMLDIYRNNVDIHNMDMIKTDDNLTFAQQKEYFLTDIQYIDKDIINYVVSLFTLEKDVDKVLNTFQTLEIDPLDITDDELMDFGNDIVNELHNKEINELYKVFKDKNSHRLHISDISDDKTGISKDLEGITLNDYVNKKSFISIHRDYTTEDITTLLHEFMHAVLVHLNKYQPYKAGYFLELEGLFGERLAIDYMRNHGMKKEANTIEAIELYNNLHNSFMLYLNDVLFSTSRNSHFRVKNATEAVRYETDYKDYKIMREDIPYICSCNAFYTITDIIDYLIVLEISHKYDIEEQFRYITELKRQDDYFFYNIAMADEFDFLKHGPKELKKLKRSLDKEIKKR